MTASTALAMPGTRLIECEFRKPAGLDQLQVFLHRAFYATVDLDTSRQKSTQCPGTYTAHDNGIHCRSAQGLQGLTIAVRVIQVLIDDRLHRTVFAFDDDEEAGRSEVAVNGALRALVILGRKGDLHVRVPRVVVSLGSLQMERVEAVVQTLII